MYYKALQKTTPISDWATALALVLSGPYERKGELSPRATRPNAVKALGRFAGARLFACA